MCIKILNIDLLFGNNAKPWVIKLCTIYSHSSTTVIALYRIVLIFAMDEVNDKWVFNEDIMSSF